MILPQNEHIVLLPNSNLMLTNHSACLAVLYHRSYFYWRKNKVKGHIKCSRNKVDIADLNLFCSGPRFLDSFSKNSESDESDNLLTTRSSVIAVITIKVAWKSPHAQKPTNVSTGRDTINYTIKNLAPKMKDNDLFISGTEIYKITLFV